MNWVRFSRRRLPRWYLRDMPYHVLTHAAYFQNEAILRSVGIVGLVYSISYLF